MKRTTVVGILAFGFSLSYLLLKSHDENSEDLEGIEIKINPEKLVNGALAVSNMGDMAKDNLRQIAHRAIKRYYEK